MLDQAWLDGYIAAYENSAALRLLALGASQASEAWDWAASWAAIVGGGVGGLISGAASGVAAYLVLLVGLKHERERNAIAEDKRLAERVDAEEKRQAERDALEKERRAELDAAEERRKAELAFSGYIKMTNWLEYGNHVIDAVKTQIRELPSDDDSKWPLPKAVKSISLTLPEPERLNISELSFLAHNKNALLIGAVMNIEAWGFSLMRRAQEYNECRKDWEIWAFENSDRGASKRNGKLPEIFVGRAFVEAHDKNDHMTSILKGILSDENGDGSQGLTVDGFYRESRNAFPNAFPSFDFPHKGANDAMEAAAMNSA